MKLILLKWKYQIIEDLRAPIYIYKIFLQPYGIFSFLKFRLYLASYDNLKNAEIYIEKAISAENYKPKIIKEYFI